MYLPAQASFDKVAADYDRLWSSTPIGMSQRSAVWDAVDPLFQTGSRILDAGCGTGVDALHFQSRGVRVFGVDNSPKMIQIAQSRGVEAQVRRIENLDGFERRFDGAISNFGALNCVERLDLVATALAKLIRKDGHLALCFLGRICAWEIGYYLLHANPKKAFRRWGSRSNSELAGKVFYFSKNFIALTFSPYFRLKQYQGIGLCVPPSYVTLSQTLVDKLAAIDQRTAHRLLLRSFSDHSLYVFERL
jgi:SAM-dependent methyltransferase